jgi:hypothetical protein
MAHDGVLDTFPGILMSTLTKPLLLIVALGIAACAGPGRTPPAPGDSIDTVKRKLGAPTATYRAGQGQVLEYATGPMGQFTWMAQIDADGRLSRYEQVLTGETFATIRIDAATKADVLRTIGQPAERSHVALGNYEVWSYRYKESGVWNSMMHVHFDQAGVVRMMQNGPDRRDEEPHFFR